MMQIDLDVDSRLNRIAMIGGVIPIVISIMVFVGWVTNYLVLAKFGPTYKPMPADVALFFILFSSLFLISLYKSVINPLLIFLTEVLVIILIVISIATFIDDLLGLPLNIEQYSLGMWFISLSEHPESRVSVFVLFKFILFGISIFLLLVSTKESRASKIIISASAMIVFIISSITLMGYLYNAPLFVYLRGGQVTTTALPSALNSLALSIGLMAANGKTSFPVRVFVGPSLNAQLMRILVPMIIALIIILNLINLLVTPHQSDYAITAAFIAVIAVFLMSFLISKITTEISSKLEQTKLESLKMAVNLQDSLFYNRSLIEASLDPLVTISKKGKITDVNNATELATGISRKKLIGSDFTRYFVESDLAKKGYETVFKKGFVKDYPLTMKNVSGEIKSVLYNAVVYKNISGKVLGVFAAARDISERKKAEEEARNYAHALEKSNEELQQFAYIASHDLQEPLRVITSYLQLIERRYKDKLDQDANEFIDFAVNGANRLQEMINDLLVYSRVQTKASPFVLVNTPVVVQHALENLQLAIKETKSVVTYGVLPDVMADESQLTMVFQNLISNAIKFRKPDQAAKIYIAAEEKPDEWVFSVTDNGIGIEPKYYDRLFIIFKRLVGKEYPGSGIGLAVCKRIIERHKGTIWVNSVLGQGATFYFTIPK